jgi:hypothetical protein
MKKFNFKPLLALLLVAALSTTGYVCTSGSSDDNKDAEKKNQKTEEFNSTVDSKKQIQTQDVSKLTDIEAMDMVRGMSRQQKTDLVKWDAQKRTWTINKLIMQLIGRFDKKTGIRTVYNPSKPVTLFFGEDGGSSDYTGNAWLAWWKQISPSQYPQWELKRDNAGDFTYTYPEGASLLEISFGQYDTDPNGYCIPDTRVFAKIIDCIVEREPGSAEGWAPWWLNTERGRGTLRAPGFIKYQGKGTWQASEFDYSM